MNENVDRLVERIYKIPKGGLNEEIRKLILDGYTFTQVEIKLKEKYPALRKYTTYMISDRFKKVKDQLSLEIDSILLETVYYKHLLLYEKIYQYFDQIGYNSLMRRTLQLRNQLIGLTNSYIEIEQNNLIVNEKTTINNFDFSRLDDNERKRLDQYLCQIQ